MCRSKNAEIVHLHYLQIKTYKKKHPSRYLCFLLHLEISVYKTRVVVLYELFRKDQFFGCQSVCSVRKKYHIDSRYGDFIV